MLTDYDGNFYVFLLGHGKKKIGDLSFTSTRKIWAKRNKVAQEKWCCSCLSAIGIPFSCVILIACFRI